MGSARTHCACDQSPERYMGEVQSSAEAERKSMRIRPEARPSTSTSSEGRSARISRTRAKQRKRSVLCSVMSERSTQPATTRAATAGTSQRIRSHSTVRCEGSVLSTPGPPQYPGAPATIVCHSNVTARVRAAASHVGETV
eukprot:4806647-Pleurochrysis_carterae.AAC.1